MSVRNGTMRFSRDVADAIRWVDLFLDRGRHAAAYDARKPRRTRQDASIRADEQ